MINNPNMPIELIEKVASAENYPRDFTSHARFTLAKSGQNRLHSQRANKTHPASSGKSLKK